MLELRKQKRGEEQKSGEEQKEGAEGGKKKIPDIQQKDIY